MRNRLIALSIICGSIAVIGAGNAGPSINTAAPSGGEFCLPPLDFRDKLYDLEIVGENIWVVGFPGIILKGSTKGGALTSVAGPDVAGQPLLAADFTSPDSGVIVGYSGLVISTADGGKSWTRWKNDDLIDPLFAVDFFDENNGWASGHFSALIHTTDGGKTWEPQVYTPVEDENTPEEQFGVQPGLNAIAALSATEAYIVGEFGTIIHTTDAGETWTKIESGVGAPLYAIKFTVDATGWVVGANGTVIRTTDRGATWNRVANNSEGGLFAVYASGNRVWAVGEEGLIVEYDANTDRFVERKSEIYTWLDSISFIDQKRGIAVGGRGHVIYTEDGGLGWKRLGSCN